VTILYSNAQQAMTNQSCGKLVVDNIHEKSNVAATAAQKRKKNDEAK